MAFARNPHLNLFSFRPPIMECEFKRLSYSQRQAVRSQLKSKGPPTIFVAMSRQRPSVQYMLLRSDKKSFWLAIILVEVCLFFLSFVLFVAVEGDTSNALALALEATAVNVGHNANRCVRVVACQIVGGVTRLVQFMVEIFLGAVVVARIIRSVTKRRFLFADFATLVGGELKIRLASNRPGYVVAPSFHLEYFDSEMRITPLQLTNGGSLALLHDGAIFLRHCVDEMSPFADNNWRRNMYGIRLSVVGYDEILACECFGYCFYTADEIRSVLRRVRSLYALRLYHTPLGTGCRLRRHVEYWPPALVRWERPRCHLCAYGPPQ